MKQSLSVAVAVLATAFLGQPALAQVPVLTNADVTRLVAMRVSDQTVIAVIQEATTQFDLSPRAVIELAVHEVSAAVIAAMRQPSTPATRPTSEIAFPEPSPAAGAQTLAGAAAEAAGATHTWPLSATPSTSSERPAPAGTAPAATASDASSAPATDEVNWRARATLLHQKVRDNRAKEGPLLNRINSLTVALSDIGPVNARRGGFETERQRLIAEITVLRESLRADMAAIQALEEEGRRAGVPPDWLR